LRSPVTFIFLVRSGILPENNVNKTALAPIFREQPRLKESVPYSTTCTLQRATDSVCDIEKEGQHTGDTPIDVLAVNARSAF